MNSVFKELSEVREHCSRPDWDGYHAHSISLTSLARAEQFARAKMVGCSAPSVGVDALTGVVSFRWGSIRRNYLSVAFPNDGVDAVTCLIGENGVFSERKVRVDSDEFGRIMEGCR